MILLEESTISDPLFLIAFTVVLLVLRIRFNTMTERETESDKVNLSENGIK
jgi:hypothetical protein